MSSLRFTHWFVPLLLLAPNVASADEKLIRALAAGVDTWQQKVSFACSYELLEAHAASVEDVEAGRYEDAPQPLARGVYAKQGDMIRLSLDYGAPPKPVSGAVNTFTNVSVEQIRGRELSMAFYPWHSETPSQDYVRFSPLYDDFPRDAPIGRETQGVLNPITVLANAHLNQLKFFVNRRDEGEKVTNEITSRRDEYIEITTVDETPEYISTYRFEFWMKPTIPLMSRTVAEVKSRSGRVLVSGAILDDFVEVSGGSVARTMRAFGTMQWDQPRCQIKIWRSEDLGQRRPTRADFQLHVPVGTHIAFLKPESLPEPVDNVWTFDLTRYTLHDLDPRILGGATPPPPKSNWLLRVLGITVLIVVIGWYGIRRYRQA